MKQHAPAADRNKRPILEQLVALLPERGLLLEIASGTGQHVVFFAQHLPTWEFQPSDLDAAALASIRAHLEEAGLPNTRPPLRIDVTTPSWGIDTADAIVCTNMIHISPWASTEGLFRGASARLSSGGLLVTYGPYRFDGAFTSPSNADFDASLRARDPSWGVRDVTELARAALEHGLLHEQVIAMPANNHLLVFRRC